MAPPSDPIRVVLADDHAVVREGLRLVLETETGIEVVGEAATGEEAVAEALRRLPDVVLMDLRMPVVDGVAATRRLTEEAPKVAVVILTTYDEDDSMVAGLRAGARGYLRKDVDRATLLAAIRAAAAGQSLMQAEVLARLVGGPGISGGHAARRPPGQLTPRERAVLAALVRGDRNKAIAQGLGITERTVKAHVASIFGKLGVETRTAAVALAVRDGLVE